MAVWSRSGGVCELPHCTPKMGHIHHVWWWSKGGPTDIDHLVGVCTGDHVAIHKEKILVTALGQQRFSWQLADGQPITPTPPTPARDGMLEDLNAAAGIHCDDTTCASTGENEPFTLRYVVDTIFDNLNVG